MVGNLPACLRPERGRGGQTVHVSEAGWSWDPSLYAGSAAYYVQGRVPYTQELVDALVAELTLDGSGRLLDVGCGPGSLALLLAPLFEHATGLDADPHMLAEAERQAAAAGDHQRRLGQRAVPRTCPRTSARSASRSWRSRSTG